MKKLILMMLLLFGINGYMNDKMVEASATAASIKSDKPKEDSKELMFQDMLMLFLLPHIEKKIDEIYANLLNYSPE